MALSGCCLNISSRLISKNEEGFNAMDYEDYEALPSHKLQVHLIAGAFAGLGEHCLMFPFDSIKTRVQSLCPCPETRCPTPMHGLASIIRREGWWRPLRGVNAIAIGAVPAHALYFTIYDKMKHYLTGGKNGHQNTFTYAASGCFATVIHDAVMNPAEVVKQRMQMAYSPYGNSIECVRCIYKIEGLAAFYRSYAAQLLMNIPFQAVHFVCYESLLQIMNPDHCYDPKCHLMAGGMAGGLAAAMTTPLDVIKTVLNTQQTAKFNCVNGVVVNEKIGRFRGIDQAVGSVYRLRGLSGLFTGLQARVIFQVPSTAIAWSIYEMFKSILSWKRR